MKTIRPYVLILLLAGSLCSCDKGYQVRFTNYYTEPIDSVSIGEGKVVFENVDLQKSSDYKPLGTGKHGLMIVSRNKTRIYGLVTIPSSGSGKYTIQIDGIRQVAQLEDLKN